jgi:hypothetical protein
MFLRESFRKKVSGMSNVELYCLLRFHLQDYTHNAIKIASEEFKGRKLDEETRRRTDVEARFLEGVVRETESRIPERRVHAATDGAGTQGWHDIGARALVGLLMLASLFLFNWAFYAILPDPKEPSFWITADIDRGLDSAGLIPHRVQSSITAQADWMVGEIKTCQTFPLGPMSAKQYGKNGGYAFQNVQCDSGPTHNMRIEFWGASNQSVNTVAEWNCTRTAESFVCRQTGASELLPHP